MGNPGYDPQRRRLQIVPVLEKGAGSVALLRKSAAHMDVRRNAPWSPKKAIPVSCHRNGDNSATLETEQMARSGAQTVPNHDSPGVIENGIRLDAPPIALL